MVYIKQVEFYTMGLAPNIDESTEFLNKILFVRERPKMTPDDFRRFLTDLLSLLFVQNCHLIIQGSHLYPFGPDVLSYHFIELDMILNKIQQFRP